MLAVKDRCAVAGAGTHTSTLNTTATTAAPTPPLLHRDLGSSAVSVGACAWPE